MRITNHTQPRCFHHIKETNKHPVKSHSHIPVFHLTGHGKHSLYSNEVDSFAKFAICMSVLLQQVFVTASMYFLLKLRIFVRLSQQATDRWRFCLHHGLCWFGASKETTKQPICSTQILIFPLNRLLAACFKGLFSTGHFRCSSIHGPFPLNAPLLFLLVPAFHHFAWED